MIYPFADTHCHLDFDRFDDDRDVVIQRAREQGLQRLLIPSVDLDSSIRAISLAESTPEIFVAIGIHPNSANLWSNETKRIVLDLIQHPKVVAIGEIGLDYYWDTVPGATQRQVLVEQLEIASEHSLPVIIHNREADQDILEIIGSHYVKEIKKNAALRTRPGVFHSYSSDGQFAAKILDMNFYIGFTGPITFKKAYDLRETAGTIPVNKLLSETDAPFLAPHPYRGKRNEPMYTKFIIEKIAEVQNLPTLTVANQLLMNASNLFQWGASH